MQRIVVLEGDQTGQELLEESLRVLSTDVVGIELKFPRFDLSLESRRDTANRIVYLRGVPVSAMEGDMLRVLAPVDASVASAVAEAAAGRRVPVLSGYVGRLSG